MTISISNTTVMTRGIANGTQRDGASLPCPPALYVRQARLENRLVFGRERRLLGASKRFGLIPLIADPGRLAPYPGKIRILGVVECARGPADRERVASAMMPSELRKLMRPSHEIELISLTAFRLQRLRVCRKRAGRDGLRTCSLHSILDCPREAGDQSSSTALTASNISSAVALIFPSAQA